jgi:hypothetical protein
LWNPFGSDGAEGGCGGICEVGCGDGETFENDVDDPVLLNKPLVVLDRS